MLKEEYDKAYLLLTTIDQNKLDPEYEVEFYYSLIRSGIESNEYKSLEPYLEEYAKKFPNDYNIYRMVGNLLFSQNCKDDAIPNFQRYFEKMFQFEDLSEEDLSHFLHIQSLYLQNCKYNLVYENLLQMLDIFSLENLKYNDIIMYQLGIASVKLKDFPLAQKCYEFVIKHSENDDLIKSSKMGLRLIKDSMLPTTQ